MTSIGFYWEKYTPFLLNNVNSKESSSILNIAKLTHEDQSIKAIKAKKVINQFCRRVIPTITASQNLLVL